MRSIYGSEEPLKDPFGVSYRKGGIRLTLQEPAGDGTSGEVTCFTHQWSATAQLQRLSIISAGSRCSLPESAQYIIRSASAHPRSFGLRQSTNLSS
jgi:hypothetical protein